MRVRPLPKKWLIHSIIYEGYTGQKDAFQNPVYDDPITINHVRYDPSTVFSRDNTQTKIVADGVIYVDAVNSSPVPEFREQSKVTLNGREMIIQKVIPCYHPTKNKIHHWELEVI